MPYDIFHTCYESNEPLGLYQEPGRWQCDLCLNETPFSGLKSPCATFHLRVVGHDDEISNIIRFFDVFYDARISDNLPPRLRQFSRGDLQFCMADYSLVRSWLSVCDEHHTDSCQPERSRISGSLDIHLINVTTRSIIMAKANTRYIALSYVWGTAYGGNKAQSVAVPHVSLRLLPKFLPPRLPQTIEDTIYIVKELGEQYL